MKTLINIVYSIAASAALTACGGGGGGADAPATGPVAAPTGAAGPSVPLITAPTPPGPSVDAESVAAFNLLNAETARCGFGQKSWNDQLQTAAKGHADWQLVNNYGGHLQAPSTPSFTGETPNDRIVAAGYAAAASEFTATDEIASSVFGASTPVGWGANSVRNLMSAPYHAIGLLAGFTEVGISIRGSNEAGSTATHGARVVRQYNLAYRNATGPQLPVGMAANALLTYPCAGTTGTARELRGESPNPVPGRDLSTSPIGQSIIVVSPLPNAVLVITSSSVSVQSTNATVAMLAPLTSANDTTGAIKPNMAVLMPDTGLLANTAYTVSITGTVNGNAFATTYQYTTGN
jgi:uncharacterized protein YkwD